MLDDLFCLNDEGDADPRRMPPQVSLMVYNNNDLANFNYPAAAGGPHVTHGCSLLCRAIGA